MDLAASALQSAAQKARERRLAARFIRQDARQLSDLGESFDTLLDCGLFHIFTGDDRAALAGSLRSALVPGGRYFMLGVSDQQPGWRPHRLTREEITAAFTDAWRVDSIEPATIDVTTEPGSIHAWLAPLTRT